MIHRNARLGTLFIFVLLTVAAAACSANRQREQVAQPTKNYIEQPAANTMANDQQAIPRPVGFTNDFENVFTLAQLKYLDSLLLAYQAATTYEIAVITIPSTLADNRDFDSLTLEIANSWGVGKKEKNNGILIGLCVGLKKLRIQNGKGIEAWLSNAATQVIIDEHMLPAFKKGNYFEGVKAGIAAIMEKLPR